MNLNDKTKAIAESAIVTALMVIIGLYTIPIVTILFPIPFIVIGVRHGTKYNVLTILATSIIVGMLTDLITGITLFISFGFISIALAYMLKKKYTPSRIMVFNSGVALLTMILSVALFNIISETSFITEIETLINSVFTVDMDNMISMGFSTHEVNQAKDLIKLTIEVMTLLVPSFIMTSAIISTYIIYWGSVAILRRLGYKHIEKPKLKLFRLPQNIILGSLVMIFGATILGYLELLYYDTILMNVGFLIMFVFFLDGLAVVIYLMDRFKFYKIIKVIVIIIALINFAFISILAIVGFIDAIFDFRKLREAN